MTLPKSYSIDDLAVKNCVICQRNLKNLFSKKLGAITVCMCSECSSGMPEGTALKHMLDVIMEGKK